MLTPQPQTLISRQPGQLSYPPNESNQIKFTCEIQQNIHNVSSEIDHLVEGGP